MGLGLSTVLRIVQYHNGSIEIDESKLLGGALFKITLFKHPKTISIVGVNNMRKDFLALCLEECGHQVSFVETDKLDDLHKNTSEIIFVDLRSNLEQRLKIIEMVSKDIPNANLIAIGEADQGTIDAAVRAGCEEYLMTPYSKETIQNRTEMVIDSLF